MNGEIRLADGESDHQGRVEVCLGGQWGTICAATTWGNQEAQVVCRQLGYENAEGTFWEWSVVLKRGQFLSIPLKTF